MWVHCAVWSVVTRCAVDRCGGITLGCHDHRWGHDGDEDDSEPHQRASHADSPSRVVRPPRTRSPCRCGDAPTAEGVPRIDSSPPGSLPSARRWEADSLSIRRHSRAGVSKDCVRRHSYGDDVDAGAKVGYQHSVVCRATGPELHSTGGASQVPRRLTPGRFTSFASFANCSVRTDTLHLTTDAMIFVSQNATKRINYSRRVKTESVYETLPECRWRGCVLRRVRIDLSPATTLAAECRQPLRPEVRTVMPDR